MRAWSDQRLKDGRGMNRVLAVGNEAKIMSRQHFNVLIFHKINAKDKIRSNIDVSLSDGLKLFCSNM